MPTGTVKWFSVRKGYGFILPDEGGADLFVHYTGIAGRGRRTLIGGARVEFDVRPGRKGPEAFDVVVRTDRERRELGTVTAGTGSPPVLAGR